MSKGQGFTIVDACPDVAKYLDAVRADPRVDRAGLWASEVVNPHWERFVSGAEFEANVRRADIVRPPANLAALEANVAAVRASDLHRLAAETLAALPDALAGPDTTLLTFPGDPGDAFLNGYMGGVLGATVGVGRIALQVSPRPDWLTRVPPAIAHEYHHSVWLQRKWRGPSAFDLLNYLIFEGRACSFAGKFFPGVPAPWTQALAPAQEAPVWRAMQEHLGETRYEKQAEFLFGSRNVPLCAGYTIGFHIVQSFLARNPDATVEEWTILEAEELLQRSGYSPTGA